MSEASCRALSAVYGVLFIASACYITYRMFKSYGYTLLAGAMLIAEPILERYFGMCRMYSLEILLAVWLYYFTFKAITYGNPWRKEGRGTGKWEFLRECTDFHWGYAAAAFVLLWLCYEVHVNSLLSLGGVACFVVIEGLKTRKKKYLALTAAGAAACMLALVNYLFYQRSGQFLFLGGIFKKIVYYASTVQVQWEYLGYVLGVSGATAISIVALALIFARGIWEKRLDNKVLYLLCMTVFTTAFFVLFSAGKYTFRERYIMCLTPFAIALYACGWLALKRWSKRVAVIGLVPLMFLYGTTVRNDVLKKWRGENDDNTDFLKAYSTMGQYFDLETETVPVVQHMLRPYYSEQVLNDFVYAAMDRETDFDIWMEFAKEYPEGIITVEQLKISYLQQDVPKMITDWTDRLSGPGIDNTFVNVSHYCFVSQTAEQPSEEIDWSWYGETGLSYAYDDDGLWICVQPQLFAREKAPQDPQVVFTKTVFEMETDEVERCYQLFVPEDYQGTESIFYRIDIENIRNMDAESVTNARVLPSQLAIYGDNHLQEYIY